MYYKCFNSDHEAFIDYGARGITVCTRWIASFRHFLEDMGRRPSEVHSLDRINNDGNYEKDNCRWTTIEIQLNNRRNTLPETKLGDKLLLMAKQLRERT
jgi:hypothetical protein